MSATRDALLADLSDELLSYTPRGRTLVAIDGVDGAGKTVFADAWAEELAARDRAVVRASIDGFHHPREVRYARGRDSAEGFYRDSFDLATFRRALIEPFRAGSDAVTVAAFDHVRDVPVEERISGLGADVVLLVDGIFLHRPELRGVWHRSVWLDVSDEVREARLVARDGAGSLSPRYSEGQYLYAREANPRRAATIIIDNNDVVHPRRLFDDFC